MKSATIKSIEAFDDLISEKEVIAKFGYTRSGLRYLRTNGKIKWSTITGQKIMYFKSDIAERMNLKAIN
jgi:hypothetical protein